MSNLFSTLVIAFVVIVFAIALLAIGWLITGKTKIEKACGRDPTKKRDDECQTCDVCSTPQDLNNSREKEREDALSSKTESTRV